MNCITITLENIEEIINETEQKELSLPKRAALFVAISTISENVRQRIDKRESIDQEYAREKINSVLYHIKAVIGFGTTNSYSADQHRIWARKELDSLKKMLLHDG